jgi:hypothetical protein
MKSGGTCVSRISSRQHVRRARERAGRLVWSVLSDGQMQSRAGMRDSRMSSAKRSAEATTQKGGQLRRDFAIAFTPGDIVLERS